MNDAPTNRSARRRWGRMELGRAIALVRGETVDLAFTTTSEWNVGDEEKLGRPHQSRPVPNQLLSHHAQQHCDPNSLSNALLSTIPCMSFNIRTGHSTGIPSVRNLAYYCRLLELAGDPVCESHQQLIRQPYQHHPTSYISAASSPLQPQMTFSKNMSCWSSSWHDPSLHRRQ